MSFVLCLDSWRQAGCGSGTNRNPISLHPFWAILPQAQTISGLYITSIFIMCRLSGSKQDLAFLPIFLVELITFIFTPTGNISARRRPV